MPVVLCVFAFGLLIASGTIDIRDRDGKMLCAFLAFLGAALLIVAALA